MQLPAVQRTVHSRKQYLGSVKIKNSLALTGLRRHQPDILTLGKTPACFFQILRKHTEHLIPLTLQLIHARINTAHKNIRRTAALIDSQETLQFFPAHPLTAQMDHPVWVRQGSVLCTLLITTSAPSCAADTGK